MRDSMRICSVMIPATHYCVFKGDENYFEKLSDVTRTDHSRPPSQGRPGALVEVICCHHASVRHLESGMHINTPGHHHSPMSLYDLHSPWNNKVVSNLPEGHRDI